MENKSTSGLIVEDLNETKPSAKSNDDSTKIMKNDSISNKNTDMVKCQKCDLNLPESEALQFGDKWFCSAECKS